jgi:hypothetical protein
MPARSLGPVEVVRDISARRTATAARVWLSGLQREGLGGKGEVMSPAHHDARPGRLKTGCPVARLDHPRAGDVRQQPDTRRQGF